MQKRYATGEITSEEYEERRAKLLRDASEIGISIELEVPDPGILGAASQLRYLGTSEIRLRRYSNPTIFDHAIKNGHDDDAILSAG